MIESFAKSLDLNIWDWVAVLIAIISLVVALISLFIAWQTLKSQRQTEQNTMPVINIGAQYESLVSIVFQILENYIESLIIRIKIEDMAEENFLSNLVLTSSKINTSDIHLELFYEDSLLDSENNEEKLKTDNKVDLFTNDTSPYRLFAEYRSHLERFNQNCQMLELQYINSATHRKAIADNYALYIMKESLELIMHTASITSMLYPDHNIGISILSYLKKLEESSKSRLNIIESKKNDTGYKTFLERFSKQFDTKAWHEVYDTYHFYRLQLMKFEDIAPMVSIISYCRYKYGTLKDYFVYN